jgi:hypothetical protein
MIETEQDFRKYAHKVMKNAHGEDYSEEATNKVVDDLIKDNPDADYGELIGRLNSGFGKSFSEESKDWYVVGVIVYKDGDEEVYSAVQPQAEKPTKEDVMAFEPNADDIKYLKVFANEESADAYADGLATQLKEKYTEHAWDGRFSKRNVKV